MKSFYGKYESYTEAASGLDREVHHALKPIFDKYIAEGFLIREISHIAHSAIVALECEKVVRRSFNLRKKEQAECTHESAKGHGKNRICPKCHKRWTVED